MKSKETSQKNDVFAKGGKAHMSTMNYAGPQKPETTTAGGAKATGKVAGGSRKMFREQSADPAVAGQTANPGNTAANNTFKASGGTTKMFGFTPSLPAKAR
jgi:hypothetical protein